MDSRINEVLKTLREMNKRLDNIEKDCAKMSGHIQFVDNVYEAMKGPLAYITGQKSSLPDKNKSDT